MTPRKEVERVFLESNAHKEVLAKESNKVLPHVTISLRVLVPKVSTFLYHLRGQQKFNSFTVFSVVLSFFFG